MEEKLEWHVKTKNPYRRLQRDLLLSLCHGKKVLDIGGGTGRTANALKEKGFEVTVVDLDKELIDYGKSHFKGIKFIEGSAESLPVSEEYDEVILEHIIEHIKDQEKVISEARRVLKKGGRLIISTPNKWMYRAFIFFGKLAVFRWSEVFMHVPGHIAELSPGEFKCLLRDFSEVRMMGMNPFIKGVAKKHPSLGIGMIAVAKK